MSLPKPTLATSDAEPPWGHASGIDRDARWFRLFLFGIAVVGPFSLNIFKPCLPWITLDGALRSTPSSRAALRA